MRKNFRDDYRFISGDRVKIVSSDSLPISYRFMTGKTGEVVGKYIFPYAKYNNYVVEVRRWWGLKQKWIFTEQEIELIERSP